MIRTIKGKEMFADALYSGRIAYIPRQSAKEREAAQQRLVSLVEEFAGLKRRRGEAELERIKRGGTPGYAGEKGKTGNGSDG
jgi:coenzyme F420-reducing hydrogenase beta subunit